MGGKFLTKICEKTFGEQFVKKTLGEQFVKKHWEKTLG